MSQGESMILPFFIMLGAFVILGVVSIFYPPARELFKDVVKRLVGK